MEKRICPICGSDQESRIEKIRLMIPEEYHLPETYHIVSCDSCGFCFADTEAELEDYNYYYTHCNSYSGMPVGSEEWKWLNETVERLIAPYVKTGSRLVDMGFGKGIFLRWLREKGYHNIMGVDPSKESVEAVKKEGMDVAVGSIFDEADDRYRESADCVFLFDVLEHLLYPADALCSLQSYLRRGGCLVISVPNYAYLKENTKPIVNMFNQEHINYFSKTSLDNLLRRCGFSILDGNDTGKAEEIVAIYQFTGVRNEQIIRDTYCRTSIQEYVDRFADRKRSIEQALAGLWKKGITEVYVWGTGAFTMWLLANTTLSDLELHFIDNNATKIGTSIGNSEIVAPESIGNPECPILICSMLYGNQIHQQIRQMGLKNDVVIL